MDRQLSFYASITLFTCKRKQEIDLDECYCVRTGQPIMKLPFTIYSKDAVFSLDNDHVTCS